MFKFINDMVLVDMFNTYINTIDIELSDTNVSLDNNNDIYNYIIDNIHNKIDINSYVVRYTLLLNNCYVIFVDTTNGVDIQVNKINVFYDSKYCKNNINNNVLIAFNNDIENNIRVNVVLNKLKKCKNKKQLQDNELLIILLVEVLFCNTFNCNKIHNNSNYHVIYIDKFYANIHVNNCKIDKINDIVLLDL